MKKLAFLLLVLSFSAFAEVKPFGTVLSDLCGDTKTFPSSTYVCTASALGTNNQYIVLNTYGEAQPIDPTKTVYLPAKVSTTYLKSNPAVKQTTYEALQVVNNGRYLVEQKVKLVLTFDRNGMNATGSLYFNNQPFFGSEYIDFEVMFHTMSL